MLGMVQAKELVGELTSVEDLEEDLELVEALVKVVDEVQVEAMVEDLL